MKYRVLREHMGDKMYMTGDTREAAAADVKHLIGRVLKPIGGKAESAPKNKAVGKAPANKAD